MEFHFPEIVYPLSSHPNPSNWFSELLTNRTRFLDTKFLGDLIRKVWKIYIQIFECVFWDENDKWNTLVLRWKNQGKEFWL